MPWLWFDWSGSLRTPSRGRRRSLRTPLLGATLAALLAVSTVGALAARLAQDDPSPAEGSAAVIAQGVVTMPSGEVAWRVARQTARLPDDAPTGRRDPGFLLGDEGAVLVTDQATGDQTRLAPGEATIVRTDARQQRASMVDAPVAYTAIELVDADADAVDDVGAGDLIFAGEAFEAPEGKRDLDLVRDALRSGESMDIRASEGNAPILVMATVGVVEVRVRGDREPTRLDTGEAGAFSGALTIRAVEVGGAGRTATFVAAVIGPEIVVTEEPTATATPPPTPRATPRATPAATSGSITVSVRNCPPGQRPDTVVPAECPLAEGDFDLALLTPDDATLTLADAAGSGASSATWTDLPFGTYQVFQTPPIAFDVYIALDSDLTEAGGYAVSIDEETPNAQITLYNFEPIAAEVPTGDPTADDDADGLTNADEAALGANPLIVDTDGDGLLDGPEVLTYGTSPVVFDTDGDGVGDGDEVAVGTDPLTPDTAPAATG